MLDTRSPSVAPRSAGGQRFRPDVEGLRALALGLVLLFHAGVPGTAGGRLGVDVFFVISGFLITGLLLREAEATGTVRLADFWARRARRILPSAVAVVVVVLAVTALLIPGELRRTGTDAAAAVLQVANWRFALSDLAGLDPVGTGSPLLHYWSLAVEEQFYLAWPLLVLAAASVARRRGVPLRRVLAVVAVVVVVLSLALSVVLTPASGTVAYLVTPTRAWQLAAGALLAVAQPRLDAAAQRPGWRRTAAWVGALGLAAVLTSAVWTGSVAYPGWAAVVPTAGTVALIASGSGAPGAVQRLLALAPVQAVGRLSFVWYLWHAPVVHVAQQFGVSSWPALLLAEVVVAGALSVVTAALVERPFRFSPAFASTPRRGLLLGAGATATGLVAAGLAVVLG